MSKQQNSIEQSPGDLGNLAGVKVIEHKRDAISKDVSVTGGSKTLATLLGVALPAAVSEVTIIVDAAAVGKIHYDPLTTATTANGGFQAGQSYSLFGDKARLDLAEFLPSAGSITMSVIVHENIPAA